MKDLSYFLIPAAIILVCLYVWFLIFIPVARMHPPQRGKIEYAAGEMKADNERMKWMIEHICTRASVGTAYGPMPWMSKEDMMADLERRWAERSTP